MESGQSGVLSGDDPDDKREEGYSHRDDRQQLGRHVVPSLGVFLLQGLTHLGVEGIVIDILVVIARVVVSFVIRHGGSSCKLDGGELRRVAETNHVG
jgi:hypothetical protein